MSTAGRLRLVLLALLAGAAVMVLELAAPRLVAPRLGTSALTWTVVIATFLLGIAVGNALGGRLADRGHPQSLRALFVLAGCLAAAALPLDAFFGDLARGLGADTRPLAAIPPVFLPASLALGAIPSLLARELVQGTRRPGLWLGLAAAGGAAGSVGGTFLAGFVLVPTLGTRTLILQTGLLLAVLAPLAPRASPAIAADRPPGRAAFAATLPGGWVLLAALAGFTLLAFEIVAGRIASDRLGSSIYTWTSVIGVVLAGLALGNALGGWLADRFAPRDLLPWLLLLGSFLAALSMWSPGVVAEAEEIDLAWPTATLLLSALAFFFPACAMGTLSPVVVRAALAEPRHDGRVVGGLYAAGTVGAVLGAGLGGYVLVPWLGLERVLLLLAFLLALAAGVLRRRQVRTWLAILLALAFVLQMPFPWVAGLARRIKLDEEATNLLLTDSRYYRIRVRPVAERWVRLEREPDLMRLYDEPLKGHVRYQEFRNRLSWFLVPDPDEEDESGPRPDGGLRPMGIIQRARLRVLMESEADRRAVERLWELTRHDHRRLVLDRLVHGYVDLQDPTWLGYEYERLYARVVEHRWPGDGTARCLFIGGGAYAFQRHVLATRGEAVSCLTAEIDPEVTRTAMGTLGLASDPRHEIVHGDARTVVADLPGDAEPFDFVFGDAFNDLAVPFHLTTREFDEALAARMTPEGVYLLNVIDTYDSGLFLGALLGTLGEVFGHVELLSVAPRSDGARETFVIAASRAPLDLDAVLAEGTEGAGMVRYTKAEIAHLRGKVRGLVLTDDHAPVETLLAPVVEDRTR